MRITIEILPRPFNLFLALVLYGFLFPLSTASDTLSITTYYPAPVAVFDRLTTLGSTYLATSADSPPANPRNVGVGTTDPAYKLDVREAIYSNTVRLDSGEQAIPYLQRGANVTVTDNGNNTWTISGSCP